MNWILLTLISAIFGAMGNVFERFILKNEDKDGTVMLIFFGLFATLIFCPPALLTGQVSLDIIPIVSGFVMAAIILLIGYNFVYRSERIEEIDRVVPLMTLNPILVLIFATLFFQEIHSPLVYFGIFLIMLGIIFSALKFSWHAGSHIRVNRLAILFCIISSIAFASKNIISKYLAMAHFQPLSIIFWIGMGCGIISLLILLFRARPHSFPQGRSLTDHALAASLSVASSLLITVAIIIGPTGLVGFLSRIEIFFVLLISESIYYFRPHLLRTRFNKKNLFQKLFGIILILVGCYFLI